MCVCCSYVASVFNKLCFVSSVFLSEMLTSVRKDGPANFSRRTSNSAGIFTSLPHLTALTVMAIITAAGLATVADLTFLVFSLVYIYFISYVAFPPKSTNSGPVFDPGNKLLLCYVSTAAVIGLLLPVAFILHGIYVGDKYGVKAAASHTFLLGTQVAMEGFAVSQEFSLPVFAFVPVFYNSRRIFSILEWLSSDFSKEYAELGKRLLVGRILGVANMAFWCFNLFGFLVPIYLPRVFKKYYYSPG